MYKVRYALLVLISLLIVACGGSAIQTAIAPSTKKATSTPHQAVPAATQFPTEVLTSTPRPTLAVDEWESLPIVPAVSESAIEIYRQGLKLGNDPNAFSKVGDCQTSTDFFLVSFDHAGGYDLGEYADLQSTIDYYQGSFSRQSMAVKDGFNVAAVLSPLRADPNLCEKGENPLACEIRLNHPSVVLISMETNFNLQTATKYGGYMRQIVEYSISQGVVPILATKADNKEGDNSINAEIAAIANEYDIPLWNFWAAVHPLPNNGFDLSLNDGFHLSLGKNYSFTDSTNMERAWPWRNLTALQALDAVRNGLNK
ncbi:MAG: SGNH/GDSL hydrolase family protein [Chloroflexi bacterium]|nr:SGNH/GDSL hydrolase family protein [Chloroflexota bacterium]